MSQENGNGHIHLLRDRQPKKPTNQQMADDIATIARAAVIPVIEHYMTQIPGLVAQMLAQAFEAHGLELKPPPKPEAVPGEPEQVNPA